MATPAPARFAQLPKHAVNEPGILSSAYRQFHGYSLRNQLLALCQCIARGIQPGPIPRSNVGPSWLKGHHAVSASHGQAHHDC
jgi:hypothetical protein